MSLATAPLSPAPATPKPAGRRLLRRFFAAPGACIGTLVLAVIIAGALLAPWIAPYDPVETDLGSRLGAPSAEFFFGTDLHGRDIFSRVLWGARASLPVGVASLALGLSVGGLIGILIGFLGGRVDAWGARAIDVLLGFPSIVLAIMIVSVLGVGLGNVVIAVAVAEIPRFARVVRGAVLVAKQHLYVDSARAIGARPGRIMWVHILPEVMPTIIVLGTLNLGRAILETATLSFLGLGTQPPTPEWGSMLSGGREYIRYAPWMMLAPGLALFAAIISINLIGDRLSALLDPRSAGRRA